MFKITIKGIVQGVGFRPHIYKLAKKSNICGYIQNTSSGVKIVCNREDFKDKIINFPPPLSEIDKIYVEEIDDSNTIIYNDFRIIDSEKTSSYSQIPADIDLCNDCINELFNRNDYRYLYPFISCMNCGPRYSIIKDMPYDREKTAFDKFKLCTMCREEYEDPLNRRYHAQTIACKNCGPKLTLYKDNQEVETKNPIKGTGGFHLASSMDNDAMEKLKELTKRRYKPFALLAKDITMIQNYCNVTSKEKEVLLSRQKPIVLLEKKEREILPHVSELSSLGFMLPSNPIQYLLFEYLDEPIVLTSSNLPSKPITTKKEEQFTKWVLDYNREIANFVDDSIVKVIEETPLIIRRSRGYAPEEIQIPSNFSNSKEGIIAIGSEFKNTIAIKKEDSIILSQHIGNTYNYDNYLNFSRTYDKLIDFTKVAPSTILVDSNEVFNVTKLAKQVSSKNKLELANIQHHIAHAFSVAIEHNLKDFIAIVCDGMGLGEDKTIWGGEIFHNDKRIGRLEHHRLIGGDIANKEPLRMLVSILSKFLSIEEIKDVLSYEDQKEIQIYYKMNMEDFNSIRTSSAGRVLDCSGILLGFSDKNYYEGRCAMLLESNSSKNPILYIEPIIERDENNLFVLRTTPIFEFIKENLSCIPKEDLASFAQLYITRGLIQIAKKYKQENKLNIPITFSGGLAYNRIITSQMIKEGVYLNKDIPPGDGGISAGQIGYYLWKLKKDNG